MAEIMIYKKDTGQIFNEQHGHPHDKDPLTTERQQEMLAMLFPEIFYDVGMMVSEGDNKVFFPDYIEKRIVNNKEVKYIKSSKLQEVNVFQRQQS